MVNLLSFFQFNLGEAAFFAIFGFVFVFVGIVLLIAIFSGLGFAMKKINAREKKPKKSKKKGESAPAAPVFEASASDELTPELIAVLTAAVTAAMEEEGGTCEFVVRRIKKL